MTQTFALCLVGLFVAGLVLSIVAARAMTAIRERIAIGRMRRRVQRAIVRGTIS